MHKTPMGFLLLAALGCGGSNDSEMIVGNWFVGAAPTWASNVGSTGTAAIAINFASDGQYTARKLQITSNTTANAEIENGTYAVSGSTLTSLPEQWTCPGPDPLSSVSISFVGSDLDLDTSSGIVSLQKNTTFVDLTLTLTDGCFDSSGNFTESPLAPVSN